MDESDRRRCGSTGGDVDGDGEADGNGGGGWDQIFSSLESLLETGAALQVG